MVSVRRGLAVAIAALAALLAAPAAASAATVWAVGDGAAKGTTDDEVGAMIGRAPLDAFLYLGDVYPTGTFSDFTSHYDPAYGSYKSESYPTPGNHEWGNHLTGYDAYWAARFSSPSHRYSFDLGGWHIISLNSEEWSGAGSDQLAWLQDDLAGTRGTCTLAFWHRPRYAATSRVNEAITLGDDPRTDALWDALAGRAAVVLSGHVHNYQRLRSIDGITELIVGTGGEGSEHHAIVNRDDARLAAFDDTAFGALRLQLEPGRAAFSMAKLGGGTLDSGFVDCQAKPLVGTASARVTSPHSATLSGTVDPNGLPTSYHFEYGSGPAYGARTDEQSSGSAANPKRVSADIANLVTGFTYHARLVATNSLGTTYGPDATFSVDTTSPTTRLRDTPPKRMRRERSRVKAAFRFVGHDDVTAAGALRFRCRLDHRSYRPCSSPFARRVKRGRHSFSVRAVDAAGNRDASPATYRWRVTRRR